MNDIFNSLITANIMALKNFKSVHLKSTDQASEEGTKQAGEPGNEAELHSLSVLQELSATVENEACQGFLG